MSEMDAMSSTSVAVAVLHLLQLCHLEVNVLVGCQAAIFMKHEQHAQQLDRLCCA